MKFNLYFLNLDDIVRVIFQQSMNKKDLKIVLKTTTPSSDLLIPDFDKDVYIFISYVGDEVKISTLENKTYHDDDIQYDTVQEIKGRLREILKNNISNDLLDTIDTNPYFLWYDPKELK